MSSPKERELAEKLLKILQGGQPQWNISGSSITGKYKGKTATATNQTRTIRESIAWQR
ncbi:MAG TPA: hypothetical protein VFM18_09005 [Methanosarcina sp.]|nr:hypothetical protein [Methanosarcina sp.]